MALRRAVPSATLSPRAARRSTVNGWPTEFPPRPLAARPRQLSALRFADAAQRPAGVAVSAPRAAGRQHAVLIGAGSASDPTGKAGLAHLAAVAARSGDDDDESASELNDAIDFIGGGDERRRRHRSELPQHARDEGQLRRRAAHAVGHGAASRRSRRRKSSGSGSRCCRRCRSASTIPDSSPTPCSIGSSTASIPTACRRRGTPDTLAAITRDDLVAFHQKYFVAEQRHPRRRRRRRPRTKRSPRVRRVFGDWETPRRAAADVHGAAGSDAARRRRQQAGRRADGSARRQHRHPAQSSRLHGA